MASESQPVMLIDIAPQEQSMLFDAPGSHIIARDARRTSGLGEVHVTGRELGLSMMADVEFPSTDPDALADSGVISYAEAYEIHTPEVSPSKRMASNAMFGVFETSEGDLNAHYIPPAHTKTRRQGRTTSPDRRAEHPNIN